MGYQLRREVRDALPPGLLTPAERVLVLEIADAAGDDTRESWPGAETLAEVTDLSEGSMSKLLSRIADKWIDLRVPVGVDSMGRPVYARHGHRTVFRFPPLPRWDHRPTSRSDDGPTFEAQGGTAGERLSHLPASKSDDGPTKGGTTVRPFSSVPSREPHLSPQPTAVESHLAEHGLAEDERDSFIRWIEKIKKVHTPDGWIINAARNGTLGDRVTEWRDSIAPRPAANPRPTAPAGEPAAPAEPCEHGTPGGQRCNLCVAARMYTELGGKHPGYLPPPLQAAWEEVAV